MEEENSLENRVSELEEQIERLAQNILTALRAHDAKFDLIIAQIDEMVAPYKDVGGWEV